MIRELNTQKIYDNEPPCMTREISCHCFSEDGWVKTSVYVPIEMEIALYVNKQKLANILCTPSKLNYLILGFLYGQGIISSIDDVLILRQCKEGIADVRLRNSEFELLPHRTLTSGYGGGVVFQTHGQKVDSKLVVQPTELLSMLKELQDRKELYRFSKGVHTSALANSRELLIMAEDIGRHNTLDKIMGECLVKEISTSGFLLLTTGRVSSEMLLKAAKMKVSIVGSRHSSTTVKAISLARDLGITLVGRTHEGRLAVYSYPERLGCY